jgi:hypothetical protein
MENEMATKKLSRTAIEGGRYGRNKWERRYSSREERARQRAYLDKVMKDPECADEDSIVSRTKVHKDFKDKLGPVRRWLETQVDRPWSVVRAELFAKFDTRTTAGRHIVYDHLLTQVNETLTGWDSRGHIAANQTSWHPRYPDYYVDQGGILRKGAIREDRYYPVESTLLQEAGKWLAGRMIGEHGGKLYWFVPNEGIWKATWSKELETRYYGLVEGLLGLKYYSKQNSEYTIQVPLLYGSIYKTTITRYGLHWEYIENPAGFKQRGELSPSQEKYFRSFPKGMQEEILQFGNYRFNH